MRVRGLCMLIMAGLLLQPAAPASAAELKTRYATVIYEREELLRRFNKEVSIRGLSYLMRSRQTITMEDEVRNKVEAVVERIQAILDMHPKDIRCKIVLLPAAADVRGIYKTRYGIAVDFIAFYTPRDKTIFLSVADVDLSVLAHELTHMVLDHYFGIAPPAKIHEVLAQFVESHLTD